MHLNCSGGKKRKYILLACLSFELQQECLVSNPSRTPAWGGLFERDERVNRGGEGACTGAYSIKPPQERITRTACVLESRSLIWFDVFPPAGLVKTRVFVPVWLSIRSRMDEYCF